MTTPPDPLAGKNYRVRRVLMQIEVDIYDNTGTLIERATTDTLVMLEADIPATFAAALADKTGMARGFAMLPSTDPSPGVV
jgi:hypothetical protein